MFCKDCGAMIPDGSAFCNVCGSNQNVQYVIVPETLSGEYAPPDAVVLPVEPTVESLEAAANETPPVKSNLPWPVKLILNFFILLLKALLFIIGIPFYLLSVISGCLGVVAGIIMIALGTLGLIFWLFDRGMGTAFLIVACALILCGVFVFVLPSLLATIGGALQGLSATVHFIK